MGKHNEKWNKDNNFKAYKFFKSRIIICINIFTDITLIEKLLQKI